MALPKLVVELAAKIREYMADLDKAATATEASAARIERADKTMVDAAKGVASGQADVAETAVQVASRMGPMGGAVAAAAAVVAGYALVSYKAAQENTALVKALALSGNQAGVTAAQLQGMAAAASNVVGTHGQAAEAIGLMVSGGKVAGENLQALTVTALNASRTLGIGVQETVKHYEALADSPAKASAKLNEAMGYLNAETYRRIQALEEMGRKDEAAALAQQTYARGVDDATKKVEASLGTLQRGWRNVGEAAGKAWDWMLGLGRKDEVQDSLAGLRKQLDAKEHELRHGVSYINAGNGGMRDPKLRGLTGGDRAALEAEAEALREQIRLIGRAGATAAQNAAASAKYQQESIEWSAKAAAAEERLKSNATKRADAIADANERLAMGYITQVERNNLVADAEQRYADKVTKGNDGERERLRLLKLQQHDLDELVKQILAREKAEHDAGVAAAKAYDQVIDRQDKATASAEKELEQQLDLNAAMGLSKVDIAELAAAKLEETAASKERRAALADEIDWSGRMGDAYRDEAAALYALAKAKRDGAAKETRLDNDKARKKKVDDMARKGRRAAQKIEDSLTDALMRGFESGKGFLRNLRDAAANMFKTLVLRPIVSAIVSPVSGAIAGMVAPAVASAGTSLLSSAGSAAGIANLFGGSGALATASGAISGFTTALTAGAQSLIGMTGTASQMVTSLTAAGHVAAPGMAAGVGAGQAALTAIPYVAVAALIANAIGLFRTTKTVGGGLTGTLGEGDINAYDLTRKSGTLFSGPDYRLVDKGVSPQSGALQTAFVAMRTNMVGMVDALGLGSGAIKNFTTSIGKDLLHPDTGGLGLKLDGLTAEQAAAKVQQALADANEEMANAALAGANLTGWMARLAAGQTTALGTLQVLSAYPNQLLQLAGTSRDALVQAFAQGLMTGDATAAGQAVADQLVASIESTMVGNASAQIFDIVNVGIITPMLDAIMAGQVVGQAISQQAMDAVVAKATAAAQAIGQVMNDAGFQAAMATIRSTVGSSLGTAGAALGYTARYQPANTTAADAQAAAAQRAAQRAAEAAATAAQRAAEEAQRAADTYANALRDAQDYIAGVAKTVGEWVDAQNANTTNPTNNLASARAAFAAQMAFARGGDRDAINGITGYADRLLQAGSERLGYIQQQQLLAQTKAQLIDLPAQLSPEQFIVEQLTPIISAVPLPVVSAIGTASDSQVQATNALAANYAAALQPVISALGTGFATLDTNLSNDLTLAELTTALQGKATDAAINALFGLIDTDNDAIIGKLEASVAASLTFGQQVKLGLASEFTKLDTSVNGLLDFTEFSTAFAGLATDATLQAVFNEIDTNGDGIITAVEAQTAANNTLFAALGAALNAGFATLDTNLSGGITQPELAAVMQGKASDAAINALFDLIDVDNDSIISKLEATTAAALTFGQQVASGLSADFTKLDTSVNGLLDFTEFSTAFAGLATNATLQAVFDEIDANGNGQITALEAIAANTVAMSAGVTFSATDPIHSVFDAIKESTGSSAYYLGTITTLIHQVEMQLARTHNLLGSIGYFIQSAYSGTGSFQIRGATSYFAKGGVFSNQVVSSPTLFNMAMMGEAGDEAIMPLQRGTDGRLGVTAQVQMPDWSQYGRNDNAALVAEIKRLNDRLARIEAATTAAAVHSADSADSLRNIKNNGLEVFNDPATPLVTEAAP